MIQDSTLFSEIFSKQLILKTVYLPQTYTTFTPTKRPRVAACAAKMNGPREEYGQDDYGVAVDKQWVSFHSRIQPQSGTLLGEFPWIWFFVISLASALHHITTAFRSKTSGSRMVLMAKSLAIAILLCDRQISRHGD